MSIFDDKRACDAISDVALCVTFYVRYDFGFILIFTRLQYIVSLYIRMVSIRSLETIEQYGYAIS